MPLFLEGPVVIASVKRQQDLWVISLSGTAVSWKIMLLASPGDIFSQYRSQGVGSLNSAQIRLLGIESMKFFKKRNAWNVRGSVKCGNNCRYTCHVTSGYLLQCRRTFASLHIFQFYHIVANKQNDEEKRLQNNFWLGQQETFQTWQSRKIWL